jgi:thiol-disulfide isomerase/thioredoxin
MLHRIAGAILLLIVGALIAMKYGKVSLVIDPNTISKSADSKLLKPVDVETVQNQITTGDHKIILMNYWASWCVPCLKEFPELIKLKQEFQARGLKLILISTDQEIDKAKAQAVLAQQGVDFETYYRGDASLDAFDTLYPNWNGALPASQILSKEGQVLDAWFGETSGHG